MPRRKTTNVEDKRKRKQIESSDEEEEEEEQITQSSQIPNNATLSDDEEDEENEIPSKTNGHSTSQPTKKKRKQQSEESEEEDDENGHTNGHSQSSSQPNHTTTNKNGSYQLPKMREGSIVRIKLYNFMTYDDCEFEPGPGLNLVLGPNGTGKSSIVGAICLGLAGSTKLIGRASKVKNFIKHGKTEAFVEIELFKKPKNVIIRRAFKVNENSEQTYWYINGKKVSNEEVKERINQFNIQLDNLTQFLPQEKVAEFAGLTPVERLKQTEQAVLPPEVIGYHTELIEIQKSLNQSNFSLETFEKNLENLKKKNQLLEKEVEKYNKRLEVLEKSELCKVKIGIIKFQNIQKEAKNVKEAIDKKAKEVDEVDKQMGPFRDELEEIEKNLQLTQTDVQKTKSKIVDSKNVFENVIAKINEKKESILRCKQDLINIEKRAQQKEQQLKEVQHEIERCNEMLKNYNKQELQNLLKEKKEEFKKLDELYQKETENKINITNLIQTKSRELEEVYTQKRKLLDLKEQRLNNLRKLRPEVYQTYDWILKNKHALKKNVYLTCLEVKVDIDEYADYLEMNCPDWLLLSFICEDNDDKNFIYEQYLDKHKIDKISIIVRKIEPYVPNHPHPINELSKYGVICYLDETFEAPDIVKNVMKDSTQLDSVAIGHAKAKKDKLLTETAIKCAFIDYKQFLSRKSSFSKNFSTRVLDVGKSKLFSVGGQNQNYVKIQQELQAREESLIKEKDENNKKLQMIQGNEIELSKKIAIVRQQQKDTEKKIQQFENIQRKLSQLQRQLQNINQMENTEEEKLNLQNKIKDSVFKQITLHEELQKQLENVTKYSIYHDKFPVQIISLKYSQKQVKEKTIDLERKKKELERQLSEYNSTFQSLKLEVMSTKEETNSLKISFLEKYKNYSEDTLKEGLFALPEEIDSLYEIKTRCEEEADKICTNPGVVVEYEQRCKEIKDLENQLEEMKESKSEQFKKIEKLKEKWLTPLQDCVQKINDTFVTFCKHVGIVGEVSLKGNETDYEKWEIEIKVKFRDDEKLTALSAHRQSGGERSVTTILYLLSLQQLNKSPFRVVDEINQGMDPTNERKIFYQMLDASQGDDIPQSFLITPKLLPNLVPENANNITILFIYNGPENIKQDALAKYFARFDKSLR